METSIDHNLLNDIIWDENVVDEWFFPHEIQFKMYNK